jgi:hypothetical protein
MKFYHGGTNKLNFGGYGHSVGTGIWFTQNKDAAISYIDPKAENGCLILVDIDLNKCKLITFDYKGKSWSQPPKNKGYEDCKTTDDLVRKAKQNGYDTIMFKNVSDMKGRISKKFDIKKAIKPSTNIVITKKEHIKLIDGWYYNDLENIREEYFLY